MASQGLRKPLKSLKKAENQHTKNVFHIFKSFTGTKKVSLFYLKAKNKEKLEKQMFKYFVGPKPFSLFLKNKKNTKQILILNSIFDHCSLK